MPCDLIGYIARGILHNNLCRINLLTRLNSGDPVLQPVTLALGPIGSEFRVETGEQSYYSFPGELPLLSGAVFIDTRWSSPQYYRSKGQMCFFIGSASERHDVSSMILRPQNRINVSTRS